MTVIWLYKEMPVKLDVMARISDTTGALMAGNYADKKCRIGVILGKETPDWNIVSGNFLNQHALRFPNILNIWKLHVGTGSNAAFVERIENYNKFDGKDPETKQVCTE